MERSDARLDAGRGVYRIRLPRLRSLGTGLALATALAVAPGCSSFNVFTEADDIALGEDAYAQVLASEPIQTSGAQAAQVQEVMHRLVAVADKPEYPWEVVLIDDPDTVNAFCLPGGKMAVYRGILPVTEGELGLAVVMGHEIAHALERHGTERVSRQMGTEWLLAILAGEEYQEAGALLVDLALHLPYGRSDELEADAVGLMLMAQAGYDPREAVAFWSRMAALGGGGPEWMSTHPSDATRIAQLEELMPQAMALYEASGAP